MILNAAAWHWKPFTLQVAHVHVIKEDVSAIMCKYNSLEIESDDGEIWWRSVHYSTGWIGFMMRWHSHIIRSSDTFSCIKHIYLLKENRDDCSRWIWVNILITCDCLSIELLYAGPSWHGFTVKCRITI